MGDESGKIARALISVFDKQGVADLAGVLAGMGVEILSTGGTAKLLREAGVAVTDVGEVTGFPEMMDGRVKTLHPRIHGGILMRRDVEGDVHAAEEHGIRSIDLVVVNLYPFTKVIASPGVTEAEAIEMIDIGGPGMVRAAAKNHAFVTVLTDPADYAPLLASLRGNGGATTLAERRAFARKAFAHTASYDAAIERWFGGDELLPATLGATFTKKADLRYGENPHQRAAVYLGRSRDEGAVAWSTQHSGKELSFNNYLDANAALECVSDLDEVGCVVIKHKNPCGAAVRDDVAQAFVAAHAGDPISAFGGIVAFNRPVTEEVARLMATKEHFFEVVVAPGYEGGSLEILQTGAKWGKNVRLLEVARIRPGGQPGERELRWIRGGMLVQDPDGAVDADLTCSTARVPTEAELVDLRFAWSLVRHVTSNAIVYAKGRAIVAVGAGQMSRIDSVDFCGKKGGPACQGAVMASDAFFPFDDGVRAAHAAGITAVVQPGGSIRDQDVVKACDELGLAMVITGRRHFRH